MIFSRVLPFCHAHFLSLRFAARLKAAHSLKSGAFRFRGPIPLDNQKLEVKKQTVIDESTGKAVGSVPRYTGEEIACVALTGSNDAGTEILHASAPTIKKSILELGGNDPLIIREDVANDPEQMLKAVECLGWRRILENNGQVCASPKRTLVHSVCTMRSWSACSPL